MPTTIAHIIGGYTAVELSPEIPTPSRRARWAWIVGLATFAANAPDLDFLPGLLLGSSTQFHRGPSHSIVATLLFAALVTMVARRRTGDWRPLFVAAAAAYGSHICLDLLIPDPMGEGGLQLLWPFSPRYMTFELQWLSPLNALRLFDPVEFNNSMVATLMTWGGLRVFLVDALLVAPLLVVAYLRNRRSRTAPPPASEPELRATSTGA